MGTLSIASTLTDAAVEILVAPDPYAKAEASRNLAQTWRNGGMAIGAALPPDRPARPVEPELRPPRDMPKRGKARSKTARIALLHALAHIELNAIDLAWDLVARFADVDRPREFYDDWVHVAEEEAKHFLMLSDRLAAFGAAYGDLPAHDGLWQAAEETAHDLAARLAVVPLVLEARGLDVTPPMIGRLRSYGDTESADILEVIYREEIGHVATGMRWFQWICKCRGQDPEAAWHELVRAHFKGDLKPPFNDAARAAAGLGEEYYRVL